MTLVTGAAPARFEIGRVIRRTFGALRANLTTYGLLALIFGAFPTALWGALQSSFLQSVQTPGAQLQPAVALVGLIGFLFIGILHLVFTAIGSAATIACAAAQFKGRTMSLAQSISAGSPHWWRIIVITILSGFGAAIGFFLVFVPGIMLALRWSVSIPVRVIEGTGARASMGRSAALTKGHRWSILGLVFIYGMAIGIVEQTLLSVFGGPAALFNIGPHAVGFNPVVVIGVLPLFQLAVFPIVHAGLASIYVELGGGSDSETVAEVFS